MSSDRTIVRGLTVSAAGQATVAPWLSRILIDIAIELDDRLPFPVDVEHVVAAAVIASREGRLEPQAELSAEDGSQLEILTEATRRVFLQYGGQIGNDDK